ncbi:preprotein translocase subunit SecB [Algoriphagus sp. NG3]|uniref:preprotein translocase subunit SecB n=1 Tax=Algoriphagus sp. NG3 TaxID=3097546 RepID=UPI002A7EF90B|nr:preprotein translocase subunit SecB [Algoriphagus sp. NG3]WPR77037.1 preprotein translocase subunit SecB [Algoriphagus sp. NG3]
MKAKFSPLQLLDFKLLESHYEFVVPEQDDLDPIVLFSSYPVEIDFDMSPIEEDGEIQLITRIEVNVEDGNKIPGYKLMVEGGGTFKISESEEIEEGLRNNLLKFSTLNMMINNLRNIIYQITNLGPLGGYLLPPIDITKLLNDKAKEQEVK